MQRNKQNSEKKSGTTILTIRQKTIYKDFKYKMPNPAEVAHFSASSGCFGGFTYYYNFQIIQLSGK